jgi:hypothetical protein
MILSKRTIIKLCCDWAECETCFNYDSVDGESLHETLEKNSWKIEDQADGWIYYCPKHDTNPFNFAKSIGL